MKEELIKNIETVFESISKNYTADNPVGLLENANMLATIMYTLGRLFQQTRREADSLEFQHKLKVAEAFMRYKGSESYGVEESKQQAMLDNRELYEKYLAKSAEAQELAILRQDVDRKISAIQSYCSWLRMEMRGTQAQSG